MLFRSVRGDVFYKGVGVKGLPIEVIGSNTIELNTNSNGRFQSQFPVSPLEGDTTFYQFKISNGAFTRTYLRQFTKDDIGSGITLPNTNLPSGQINLLVSDGVNPLKGAKLQFGISGGKSDEIITGTSGAFESEDNLRKATYVVSVSKAITFCLLSFLTNS